MPLAYHHHMAAAIETEPELDLFMKHSGEGIPLLYDAGHMAFAGGDVLRVIDKHHARISHVHTKDVRTAVIDGLDRTQGELPRRGGEGRLHRARRRQPRLRGDREAARRPRLRGLVRRRGRAGPEGQRRRWRWRRSATRSSCASWTRPATPWRREAMNRMDGKICVVTGSTQGLGAAIARRLAEAGAAGIVTLGRSAAKGEAVAEAITRDTGRAGALRRGRPRRASRIAATSSPRPTESSAASTCWSTPAR